MNICLSIVVALMFLINLWLFSIRNINAWSINVKGLGGPSAERPSLQSRWEFTHYDWSVSFIVLNPFLLNYIFEVRFFLTPKPVRRGKLWPFPAGLSSRTSRPKHSSRDGKTGEKMFIKTQSSIQKMIRRNPETNVTRRVTTVYRPKILLLPRRSINLTLKVKLSQTTE